MRIDVATRKRLDHILYKKVEQSNKKGVLDIKRLIKKRYITDNIEINYLIDTWHMVEEAIKILDSLKFQKFILNRRDNINGLFSKKTMNTKETLKT